MHARTRRFSVAGLVVLVGTLALLLSGCGGTTTGTGTNKAKDQTLKLTWNSGGGGLDVSTLDPGIAYSSDSIPPTNLIFDTLVTLDKNLKVIPWAAESYSTPDNGKTWVFKLRANQKFSDGTPVKASDFAWSMDRQFNPCGGFFNQGTSLLFLDDRPSGIIGSAKFAGEKCTNGQVQGDIKTLVGSSIIPDDSANTLTIKLTAPSAYFLGAMTLPFSAVVERKVIGDKLDLGADFSWKDNLAQGATGQGGSGMFYVSIWDHNGKLYMKPNPNWWGVSQGKKPNFSEVQFNIFDSGDTLYQAYQSDQTYAYSNGIPAPQRAAAKGQPDYVQSELLSTESIGLNWNIAPFNDINARKAFCLALNRDQINTSVLKGGSNPEWNLVPPGVGTYTNPGLKGVDGAPTSGDTTKAKQYWQQYLATLNGKPVPQVVLSFNVSSNTQKLLAETYQATWKELFPEANVTINQTPWKQLVPLLFGGKLQLSRSGWLADYPDPQNFLSELYKTGSGNNSFNASVPAADQLLNQADAMGDPAQQAQRYQLYNQAEQLLVDNVAVCPMFSGINYYRERTWVKDFKQSSNGNWTNDTWLTGYIAAH